MTGKKKLTIQNDENLRLRGKNTFTHNNYVRNTSVSVSIGTFSLLRRPDAAATSNVYYRSGRGRLAVWTSLRKLTSREMFKRR